MRIIGKTQLLELKHDLVFQEIFGKQKNHKITADLLSLILGREIKNIDLDVNKRMLGNRIDSKNCRLDIRAKFNNGEDCNIELQVLPYKYMDKRMLEYWASMYSEKISRGEDYKVLKPSISILIADYTLPKLNNIDRYHTIWNLREHIDTDKILLEDIEMHILEIPKIKNIKSDRLALWLKFIENPKNKEVQTNMDKKENKYLKQAQEELAYLSSDPDFKRILEARIGFLKDQQAFKEEGIEIGEEKGHKDEKLKIAKKLLDMGMPIEQISQITELTKEVIEKL